MLMGYHRYCRQMSVAEYARQVIKGDLYDPTVSMQMNRGFRPICLVEHYNDEPLAGDAGVLIVWENPGYSEKNG
jgi:hypothetical protein